MGMTLMGSMMALHRQARYGNDLWEVMGWRCNGSLELMETEHIRCWLGMY